MMSCFGGGDIWEDEDEPRNQVVGKCPSCGADVNKKGAATYMCGYSEERCEECGDRPCNGSC